MRSILTVIADLVVAVILASLLLLMCSKAEGATGSDGAGGKSASDEWCVLCLDRADLRYQSFKDRRDPYTPDKDDLWGARVGLDWDLQLLRYGFWRNDVHAEQLLDGRVKTVGWHWFLGLKLPPLKSEVFHEHHSQHVLDERPVERDGDYLPQGYRKFPVEDSYGVRIHLYIR